ncbi:MAG: hypothetical protein ACLRWP_03890 [Bilophila wadsworthia]
MIHSWSCETTTTAEQNPPHDARRGNALCALLIHAGGGLVH